VPYLPGVATTSDVMRGLDLGLDRFKFFPATASGGTAMLKAFASVFGEVRFCPTGGITEATAPEWLALEAVLCIGGSWVVPKGPLDTAAVEAAARRASALG
jgi:2-dehydro-3-deoxyphosphogluconate aldolase/(4S)-4-hydroxy-2-oxoglutarate aldolase